MTKKGPKKTEIANKPIRFEGYMISRFVYRKHVLLKTTRNKERNKTTSNEKHAKKQQKRTKRRRENKRKTKSKQNVFVFLSVVYSVLFLVAKEKQNTTNIKQKTY